MNADLLARSLQEFLAESRTGVIIEDGQVMFDLGSAQYAISLNEAAAFCISGQKSATWFGM